MRSKKTKEQADKAAEHDVTETKGHEDTSNVSQDDAADKGEQGASTVAVEPEQPRETILEERLLRLQADFENFRKRTLREKEDLYRRANEDIMLELLPVLDHLELAFLAAGTDGEELAVVKGFRLVGEQLQQALQKFGLQPIETEDVDFDPNVHEAIQHLPSDKVPENAIIARTRAGYMLGNRLLRAAQVVVSSGPQDQSASAES